MTQKREPFSRGKYKEQLSVLVKKKCGIVTLCFLFASNDSKKNGIINSFIFTAGSEHTLSWILILVLLTV